MSVLDDLTDVDTTGRVVGDRLAYNGELWIPKSPEGSFEDKTWEFTWDNWREETELDPVVELPEGDGNAGGRPATPLYEFTVGEDDVLQITGVESPFVAENGLLLLFSGWREGPQTTIYASVTINDVDHINVVNLGVITAANTWGTGVVPVRRVQEDDVVKLYVWANASEIFIDYTARMRAILTLGKVLDDVPYLLRQDTLPLVAPATPTLTPLEGGTWSASNNAGWRFQTRGNSLVDNAFAGKHYVTGPGDRVVGYPFVLGAANSDGNLLAHPTNRNVYTHSRPTSWTFRTFGPLPANIDD